MRRVRAESGRAGAAHCNAPAGREFEERHVVGVIPSHEHVCEVDVPLGAEPAYGSGFGDAPSHDHLVRLVLHAVDVLGEWNISFPVAEERKLAAAGVQQVIHERCARAVLGCNVLRVEERVLDQSRRTRQVQADVVTVLELEEVHAPQVLSRHECTECLQGSHAEWFGVDGGTIGFADARTVFQHEWVCRGEVVAYALARAPVPATCRKRAVDASTLEFREGDNHLGV